jgi:hypothetical protein
VIPPGYRYPPYLLQAKENLKIGKSLLVEQILFGKSRPKCSPTRALSKLQLFFVEKVAKN